jgi:transposase
LKKNQMEIKLPDTIESCHELIQKQMAVIAVLENRVKELERRLGQNSGNSHRPPSSDGFKKKPALVGKQHKRGGQDGHKGNTLKMVERPDSVVALKAEVCSGCGEAIDGKKTRYRLLNRRQVFDLPPELRLYSTEYQNHGCYCSGCGHYNEGQYPQGVSAPVQYGSGVKSLVTLLHQRGCMSVKKIKTLFDDLFSAPINEATILQSQHTAYTCLAQEEAHIAACLHGSEVVHADESGIRVAKKGHWLHTLGNELYTYQFVHKKRGFSAHEEQQTFLKAYKGWLIHDFYPFYFRFTEAKHAVCNAHVLRELQEQIEAGRVWAKEFKAYLLQLYEQTAQGKRSEYSPVPITRGGLEEAQQQARQKYRQLLEMGYEEDPPAQPSAGGKGRPKNTKGANLLMRLDKKQDAVLAFAWHDVVPFTNNLAERDIRPAKVRLKVAGCFRTFKGAQVYARINSFISTVSKHGLNAFSELVNIFNRNIPDYRILRT